MDTSQNVCDDKSEKSETINEMDASFLKGPSTKICEYEVTLLEIGLLVFCIASFLLDIGSDIFVSCFHLKDGNIWYFGLTVAFIVGPSLTMTCFSLRWYLQDESIKKAPATPTQWVVRFFFLLLQLGPLLRDTTKQKERYNQYYEEMAYEQQDATMLRLFECYLESAPQLVLQLYILARSPYLQQMNWTNIITWISVFLSLVSLSSSLVSFQIALRISNREKKNLTFCGMVVMFIWRFFIIASRMVALALFASHSPKSLGIFCGIHWSCMVVWIKTMKTNFCNTKYEELIYNIVLGFQFIFCYVNLVDNTTRFRFTVYYVVIFAENTVLMSLWHAHADQNLWYHEVAMPFQFLSFFIGIVFMLMYYLLFHPTNNIKICIWRDRDQAVDQKNPSVLRLT
ncbi:XK-related protein 6-like isoform X2 [Tachypleus tridentatus]|uniref:XK-related protein 6-like isoform X2 n=1 Tax=Tachypleus tridentatus TaxID=6853 RepID=UPI003FD4F096